MTLLLSVTQLGPPAHAAPPPPGSTCTLTPVLRDFTVNQGVGSTASAAANYNPLTRGKETLLRLFFSRPSCATGRTQSVSLTGATVTMSIPGAASKTYPTLNPFSSSSPAPLVLHSSAPATDASADPKFVIPGADLVSADPATRFAPTFRATITYITGETSTPTTATFSAISGGGAPISATVEHRSKALRVLVVPMHAALSSTDSSTLQAGLSSLSQKLPVPKAGGQLTGPLTSTSSVGGIRYAVNAGAASVPLQTTTGKYCGNLNNFDAIKAQLAQYRNDWNAANSANTENPDANPTADIVLGVISASSSLGSESGCAEGMASTNSPVAWVRLVPPTTTPSNVGSLMAMEVAHTFNAQGSWGDPISPTHSSNTQADAGTNRAYNVSNRSFLSDDRTTMRAQSTGWNSDTTLYEQRDFNFLLCRLGGAPNADCLSTGTVGTINGVANGPTFVLSGTTNNTPEGTSIVESFSHEDIAFTPLAPPGPYRVEFVSPAGVTTRYVDVQFRTSDHDLGAQTADSTSPLGLVTLAVPFEVGSTSFRFVYDTPAVGDADVVLFESNQNGRPALRGLTATGGGSGGGGFVNYTDSAGQDTDPALTQDGAWIAWISERDGRTLEVASTGDSTRSDVSFPNTGPAHPAWNPRGDTIAYADSSGNLYTVPVDTTGADGPVLGTESRIYDGSGLTDITLPAADNPTFSPDGSTLAFDAGGRIYAMNRDGGAITALTEDPEASGVYATDPSWSQTPGDERIAFTGGSTGEGDSGIYVVDAGPDVDGPRPSYPLTSDAGSEPSWGTDGLIAYTRDGRIVTFDTTSEVVLLAAAAAEQPAIDGQSGRSPAYVRPGISAYVRDLLADCEVDCSSQADVFLERPGGSVSAVGGIDGGSTDEASLSNLRLTLYYQCPGVPERSVLALALPPTSVAPAADGTGTASFSSTVDESSLCGGTGGGVLTGILSDFFSTQAFPGDADFDPVLQNEDIASSARGPVPSIVYPADGATFLEWESIALQGEGTDAALQQLPDSGLTWSVAGRTRTGSTVDLERLPVGDHTVTLQATDPGTGLSEATSRRITVLADSDRDGLSDAFENAQPCFPLGASTDPESINDDSDGDGIPNGQDPSCESAVAYSPTAVFDPETLFVPSKGAAVTMYVHQDRGVPDLAGVVAGSVRLVSITGARKSGGRGTVPVGDTPLATNRGWLVSGTVDHDQLGIAKFDRQLLNAFIAEHFVLNQKLTLTLAGYSGLPAFTFTGSGTTLAKKG